jgi:2-methylisocitrate lyase-like PEP mutase family enzyme
MPTQREKAARFRQLHADAQPLLILPNPWDAGSAKVFAKLGFDALATTSSGFAGTLGRHDGRITRDEALAHVGAIAAATDLPVSADLENGFAHDPADVAQTVALVAECGAAGCSVEDYSGRERDDIYDVQLAAERVVAAVEAAHRGGSPFVLTARAENHIHGLTDLADTIARLQAYQEAGADALYAPGLTDANDIRSVVTSVDLPLNVLALPGTPSIAELAEIGVRRVSVGGAFSLVAIGAVAEAARELLDQGTYGYWKVAGAGGTVARDAYTA